MEKEIWKNPKQERSLDEAETPLWFWNDKLEKEELQRQLKLQTDIGVKCTNPHARTNGGEGYIGGYLDEEWFDNIKTVLDYKKEHGEKMWLYDEIDWPAGTCNQTITLDERNREQYVTIEAVEIPKNQVFRSQVRKFEGTGLFEVKEETDKTKLAYNITIVEKETNAPYELSNYFIYDMFGPELEFQSEKDAVAYITKVHTDSYETGGNEQVNYLDKEATKQFLKSTYDEYYKYFKDDFGGAITTVFNDETRMCNPIAWSRSFSDEFWAQKGYDIRKNIYQLIIPGEEAGRVRCDYFDVLASLFQKNYFGEIQAWCKEHNLKLFAHLLGEETLFGHARYSGDYMRQNRHQDICGADHLGKGIGSLNIKFTSCGAHSYGKTRTAVEVFAGCGWDMTFEEYSRIVTWMFQQGMHTIINHGFFYSDRGNRKNDWPPSQFFQWQGWNQMSEGNDMIRRLNYALTDGINEADILVYHPMESFWLHYLPNQHYTHAFFHGAFLKDEQAKYIDREMQLLLNRLSSENMDFDLIHKDAVENFEIRNSKIVNKLNGQTFSALLLPMCEVLPLEMAKLCEAYALAGGKIVAVDTTPVYAMKKDEDEELRQIFERIEKLGCLKVIPAQEKEKICDVLNEQIPHPIAITKGTKGTINNHPAYEDYLIDPYLHGGEDLSGVLFNRYLKEGKRHTLFMNYSDKPDQIEVKVETAKSVPEIWNTFTGEIQTAKVVSKEADGYVIELDLPCNYGMIVVSD
ncbi:glycosyl hydrolase [Konateibacter massiliensis]|uniref:glycosyl hydrolase n=1 Tax=Konateibacter massiliensis TaxID=2002841 RepID=UPI0015D4F3A4|nr:glycosyl hydrolase [Konateibacter massiliensis]